VEKIYRIRTGEADEEAVTPSAFPPTRSNTLEVRRMRAIFISYRRNDTEGQAGRLFDDLKQQFGENAVFMDVAGLEAGRDFRRAIDDQVASCGVLLAIIGRQWLTAADEHGVRRLDDPMDFVRLETASALKRDIPVVPVLVQGARMPRADELPDNLKDLSYRNAVELTHARWDSDVQVLIKALRPFVQVAPAAPSASPGPTSASTASRKYALAGVAVLVLALILYGSYRGMQSDGGTQPAPTPKPDQPHQNGAVAPPVGKEPVPPSAGRGSSPEGTTPPSHGASQLVLTFRDWEGSWDLKWEFNGQWYERPLSVKAAPSGITGDYVNGSLEGRFADGDFSKVTGEIANTTNTGTTCSSGRQTGSFMLALAADGRSMEGWWDVCSEGTKWVWKAARKQ
jgi:hypothetical protein